MKWITNVILLVFLVDGSVCYCPSFCSCKSNKSSDVVSMDPLPDEQLRLKCGGSPTFITELKEIDLSKIWNQVVSLNLSTNAISTLSRELHLPNLQKLDVSSNQITLIESDAFYNMSSLQRLDLSHNQISNVYKEMFKGLINLERLLLAHNHISVLAAGTFEYLIGLKQIDITENPLICDCELLWVGDWSRNTSIKLVGNPKCAFPENMTNRTVRKLKIYLDLSACGSILPLKTLIVTPEHDQVVFEGDALTITCNAPFASVQAKYELKWIHPMLEICDANITNTDMLEEGIAETMVYFKNITEHQTGNWTCMYSDQNHLKHNQTVKVLVLSNSTKYCPTDHLTDNKGLYSWPQLLVNHTVTVPCRLGDGYAHRKCLSNATWSNPNTTECSYISNVTKLLQQFALLNVSLVQYSALNATERLAMLIEEKTYPIAEISDPDDVMFIAQAIRNYMQYINEEKDLASKLLDVISASMNITSAVMMKAESQYEACTDVARAAEEISLYTNNIQGHKNQLAVESFPVRAGFNGVTCLWHSLPPGRARFLHCTTTNRTVAPLATRDLPLIHATVQIPQSLLYSTTESGALIQSEPHDLVVSMYDKASLFPLLPEMEDDPMRNHRSKDYYGRSTKREDMNMEITSPVVGFQLRNLTVRDELLEPIIVTLTANTESGAEGRAAVWDWQTRRWSHNTTDCKITHALADMVIVSCTRMAYVGLLQSVETGIYGAKTDGARFKVSHPAVYVGGLLLGGCALGLALTYAAAFRAIQMPRRAKHALPNTWLALALLCLIYTLGIYQTEDVRLCQVLGLLIHYLTLASLLWMCVSASQLYEAATRTHGPVREPDSEQDAAPDAPLRQPVLGLYLVGWGAALIVCGIAGAVNLRDYAGYAQCFLSSAPALSALLVPAAILLLLLAALFLLTRCTLRGGGERSEGTQATEAGDLELWEPADEERRSLPSRDSEPEDAQHAPLVQLRAQVIVLALFLAAWASGAVAVYRPLPAYLPYQEDICSILYAIFATVLGTFILFFYGIARSDVRAQWALMHCYFRRSKRCCRSRSVFDANRPNLLPPPANGASPPIPNDNRSRSGSRSSNRTTSKTNNSAVYRAGAELNGQTLPRDVAKNTNVNGKNPNINLVVLHRQQYRSNNSMMTSQENPSVGPEVFYNPNQMNVAKKFFKKQRQNMKKNILELPSRRDCDNDSHFSLPLPTREAYNGMANIINSGSKVNNTNIHVERSNSGIKETRHTLNPNLLEDDSKDYKCYSVDRKSWINKNDDHKSNRSPHIMNIYTNVPETIVPQHQVMVPNEMKTFNGQRSSISEECLQSQASEPPEMRTVSQQCSLEYSSASELAMPHTCSDQTLNTQSEMTSYQDTHSALCSTNEITDTESFGQYIDYLQPAKSQEINELKEKSLQDISEECTMNSDDINRSSTPQNMEESGMDESDNLLENPDNIDAGTTKLDDDKDDFFLTKTTYDFETCSTNASEQGFENESDIYCPNYQMSEVSIRSHGLYAPSPSSMCPNEISFSNEDVSNIESQYVNYDPGWRKTIKSNPKLGKYVPAPKLINPDDERDGNSPESFSSEIDELYTQITSNDRTPVKENVLDMTMNSDVTLKPCDSDSCVSETVSELAAKSETTV